MAYGKNKERKDWSYRSLPLAVGELTGAKLKELGLLQSQVLELMREMSLTCFTPFPLINITDSKILDNNLVILQKSKPLLNAAWCEQARMRVKPALEQVNDSYFKCLAGSLRYADSLVKVYELTKAQQKKLDTFIGPLAPKDPVRLYTNVPVSIQDAITKQELNELKLIGETPGVIEWFKDVIVHGKDKKLTTNQLIIVKDIYDRAQAKHLPPDFGAKDGFTLQLHLDARMLPSVKQMDGKQRLPDKPSEAIHLRNGEAYFLKDDENTKYRRFLDISGVSPHDKRIRIPVVLTREISRRLEGTVKDFASIIIELTTPLGIGKSGQLTVTALLVCAKTKPVFDLKKVTAIVGRDFGYGNTISLSVAVSDTPIDLSDQTSVIRANCIKDAKTFFQTHSLPSDVEIVERIRYSGKNFLNKINIRCNKIDKFNSKIDLAYNELGKLKEHLFNSLNLLDGDLIHRDQKYNDPLVKEFFRIFDLISDLKKARRAQYASIKGLKKSWFGFLNNEEVKLAKKYNAAIVREDLTVVTIEKENPEYRGKTFNKTIDNGSKGQYQTKASAKHLWNCILELIIGSWYTSRACVEHAVVVDKKHRDGEKLYLPCCDKHVHADEHAADTIASYLFLKPRITQGCHHPKP